MGLFEDLERVTLKFIAECEKLLANTVIENYAIEITL